MNQLALNIIPKLSYGPENFVRHSGVGEIVTQLTQMGSTPGFSFAYVQGAVRTGKTHLSIALMDILGARGVFPRLFEGGAFDRALSEVSAETVTPDTVVIVDDGDEYLSGIRPGHSGPFVSFFERIRLGGGRLFVLSGESKEAFPCDEHVKSRLNSGASLEIGAPDDLSMRALIEALSRQRGIKLDARELNFIEKRLRKDIPSIELYLGRLQHLSQVLGKPIGLSLISDAI